MFATLKSYIAKHDDRRDEVGATAVEYALLTAGIAIGLFAAVSVFGGELATWFTGLGTAVGI